ncbi:hypothetical protein Pint_33655 [Pistacia integerrima]|uniref:Uncharacterized protein n=1 Tax=Pistacia integerrima TaxID=434235 RepID=A0ACC0X4B6_9ROSI|nr:hypothetical protein Pint_33655 [Pistacia integerrima]
MVSLILYMIGVKTKLQIFLPNLLRKLCS